MVSHSFPCHSVEKEARDVLGLMRSGDAESQNVRVMWNQESLLKGPKNLFRYRIGTNAHGYRTNEMLLLIQLPSSSRSAQA